MKKSIAIDCFKKCSTVNIVSNYQIRTENTSYLLNVPHVYIYIYII